MKYFIISITKCIMYEFAINKSAVGVSDKQEKPERLMQHTYISKCF